MHEEFEGAVRDGGLDGEVTAANLGEYVNRVARYLLVDGVRDQVEETLRGIDDVFPSVCLRAFTRTRSRAPKQVIPLTLQGGASPPQLLR